MTDFQTAATRCLAANLNAAGTLVDQGYNWSELGNARLHVLLPALPL
jgi:hypothetical protein